MYWNSIYQEKECECSRDLDSSSSTEDLLAGQTFQDYIITLETIQISFFLQAQIMSNKDAILVGESGSGKTWLMRNILSEDMPKVASDLMIN